MADPARALDLEQSLPLIHTLSRRAGRQLDRLDHWPLEEWAGAPGLRFSGSDSAGWAGVLVVPVNTGGPAMWTIGSGGPAWIRWIAVDDRAPLGPRLREALRSAAQVAREFALDGLWLLCDSAGWLDAYLRDDGYRVVDEVITLERSPVSSRRPAFTAMRDPVAASDALAPARFALPGDSEAVAALDARAFRDPWRYAPATLARELSTASVARVAQLGSRLVGYATAVVREGGGHVNRIAVDPAAQGRGIGRALLADMNGQLLARGASRITLNTQRSNAISQRLYRAAGFRTVGPPLKVYHRPFA